MSCFNFIIAIYENVHHSLKTSHLAWDTTVDFTNCIAIY